MTYETYIASRLAIYISLFITGTIYAAYIKHRPFKRTYWSVVLGVFFTGVAIMAAQYFYLARHDASGLWLLILDVPLGFFVSGLPMMALQEHKHREQLRKAVWKTQRLALPSATRPRIRAASTRSGRPARSSDRDRIHMDFDFIIWLAADTWENLTPIQKQALIDHELCHCEYDRIDDKRTIRPHDIEEFNIILQRYGFWRSDLERTKRAIESALQMKLPDVEPTGGVYSVEVKQLAGKLHEMGAKLE